MVFYPLNSNAIELRRYSRRNSSLIALNLLHFTTGKSSSLGANDGRLYLRRTGKGAGSKALTDRGSARRVAQEVRRPGMGTPAFIDKAPSRRSDWPEPEIMIGFRGPDLH